MDMILEVKYFSFAYGSRPILSGVSFSLRRGDFATIVDVDSAGKSMLMKLLLAELPPQQGRIMLFGRILSHFRDWLRIGYIPQSGATASENFPATTEEVVRTNLYSQTGFLRFGGKRQREQTHQALESVSILPHVERMLSELSNRQQQRMVLARVPATNPRMILLDELTTGVDVQTMQSLYELLGRLNREAGLIIIMITHNIAGAMNTVSWVLCLEDGSLAELNRVQLLDEMKHQHKHPVPPEQTNRAYSV